MFFGKKESSLVGLVFDIGTVSLSATLFEIRHDDVRPHILKTFRTFHKTSLKDDQSHFSKATLSQFNKILGDVRTFLKDRPMPKHYLIGLSSIFYLAKTLHFHETRQMPQTVGRSDIDAFVQKGTQDFLSSVDRNDIVIFETVFMKTMLNGYPIEQPVGKVAQEIDFSVHFAATSKELYDSFVQAIHTHRADALVHFSTLPIVAWNLMREILFPEHSSIIVDIGGELTEVTFLVDGVVTEILALPFGVLNILMRISESEKIDLENALSLLKTYTAGGLSKDVEQKIRGIMKTELRSWEQIFERVWQRAMQNMMADIRMFFLGGGALIDDMKSVIVPPLLHPDLAKGLHVSLISPDAFRDKFGTYSDLEGPSDFGLVALILSMKFE